MHYNLFEGYLQDSWKVKPRLTVDFGLRLSYFGPWTDNVGGGMAAWDQSEVRERAGRGHQLPGRQLHGEELEHAALRRRRQLVLRDAARRLRVGHARATARPSSAAASACTATTSRSRSTPACSAWARACARTRRAALYLRDYEGLGGGDLPGAGNAIDINDDKQPLAYTWSLTLNQKLPWSMNVELGYVGNKNENLLNNGIANINAVPLGAMINNPDGNEQQLPAVLRPTAT